MALMAMTHPLVALALSRTLARKDGALHAASTRPSRGTGVETHVYLVEHYGPDVSEGTAAALADRLARAARARRAGVRLIGSACVPADESFLSLYAAASADAVAAAVARAGVVADRIVPVLWLGLDADEAEPR